MKEWFCTDPDCMQYCKKIGKSEYKFIQAVYLDKNNEEHTVYAVCTGYIDLDLYMEEDIEGSIGSYGYTMETIKEIYGDSYKRIIAECLFEDDCLYNSHPISGVVSWDDAKRIIDEYMEEN